jgi:multidrug transporter EmrE-like cation transporter
MGGVPLIITAVLIGAVGQVLMKVGMGIYGQITPGAVWREIIPILGTWQVTAGLLCYGASALLWIAVLSKVELSMAYPLVSVGYVLVVLASWLFLGEQITTPRMAGLALIVAGVVAISRS